MTKGNWSRLSRPRYEMPSYVRDALRQRGLMDAYRARPPCQQNDYLWWITTAKRERTRQKRLAQMLDELQSGDVYMGMPHKGLSEGGSMAERDTLLSHGIAEHLAVREEEASRWVDLERLFESQGVLAQNET